MRTTFFLILLIATFCKTGKFLSTSNDGSPLTFTIIEENICQITRYQAKPDSIIPGDSLEFKMQFSALQEIYIKELFLDTLNNGVSLYTDSFAIDKTYAIGEKDVVGFTVGIPAFCPSGSWDIYLYLKDGDGNNAAILLAHFDV